MTKKSELIRAAGAVLWRATEPEKIEIALVHRPRYDDWTLPKGKVEPHEHELATAYREVLEETGVKAIFGPELGEIEYDAEGVEKTVRFWSARAHEYTQRVDDGEVDEVRWLPPTDARALLTYELDQRVLNTFLTIGTGTNAFILLRHCKAIKRSTWDGDDDDDRPLDAKGAGQAARLVDIYRAYADIELHSSDATRSQQSLAPLVKERQSSLITEPSVSEYAFKRDKAPARAKVLELVTRDHTVLLCSHRPVLPALLDYVLLDSRFKAPSENLEPGAAWVVHSRAGVITQVDYLEPPVTPRSIETD